jgi:hypothetical protein
VILLYLFAVPQRLKENALERHFDNELPPVLSRRSFLKKAGSGATVGCLSSSVATSSFAQQLGLGGLSINQRRIEKCRRKH